MWAPTRTEPEEVNTKQETVLPYKATSLEEPTSACSSTAVTPVCRSKCRKIRQGQKSGHDSAKILTRETWSTMRLKFVSVDVTPVYCEALKRETNFCFLPFYHLRPPATNPLYKLLRGITLKCRCIWHVYMSHNDSEHMQNRRVNYYRALKTAAEALKTAAEEGQNNILFWPSVPLRNAWSLL